MNRGGEQASVAIVDEIDLGPILQCALDARTQSAVRQQSLRDEGDQNRIADVGVARADLRNRGPMAFSINRPIAAASVKFMAGECR